MKKSPKTFSSNQFRDELVKVLPGFKWTVHRSKWKDNPTMTATGIQSAGFNRLFTIQVSRRNIEQASQQLTLKGLG